MQRRSAQETRPRIAVKGCLDNGAEIIKGELAGVLAYVLPIGAHKHNGGPCLHIEGSPGAKLPIVHHRVGHPQAASGCSYVICVALGYELARVNADNDKLARKCLFQPAHGRQYVDAVDSAVGPEIEENKLAPEHLPL